jgi:riboflavin kinase/FMN adenylyltransferase
MIIVMQHIHSLDQIQLNNAWLTIGVYDGVHRGHQAILTDMIAAAHAAGDPAVVLTFDPHPALVLGHRDLRCLTTPAERADLLAALGADAVVTLAFDRALADTSAPDFMSALKACLGLKQLWAGYDTTLGKNREGNVPRLIEIGRNLGYTVHVVEAVSDESGVISSTAIRKLIAVGKVEAAAVMLTRPYFVSGAVVHGDGRGRTIGIPTANIDVPANKAMPANGVYACYAIVDGTRRPAVTNVGLRPTFGGDPAPRIEMHILDFDADLYGTVSKLEFVARLRDEVKFPGVDALVAQIRADIQKARALLEA